MTEAGIPILTELRKQFVELGEEGITVGDVFDKISNRMVPFEMVSKVFKNMTSEGGKFYQMQEIQAETLRGKISNLKDAYDIMFDKMGSKNMGMLKGAVDWVRSLAENYQRTGRWLAELVVTYGTYKVALALAAVGEKAVVAVSTITKIASLARTMKNLTGQTHLLAVAMRVLGSSGLKSAIAGLAAGFAFVVTWIVKAIQNANEFRREIDKMVNDKFSSSARLADDFKALTERLREATVGSGEYRRAISELNNKYGEYLPNLLTEKNALEEIALAEQSVTNAIYAKAKAYAETEGMQKIEEKYGSQISTLYDGIVKYISPYLGKDQAERFTESFKQHVLHTDDPLGVAAYFEQFFGKSLSSVLQGNTQYLLDIGNDYIKVIQKIGKEYDKLQKKIDNRWGNKTAYSSEAQYQAIYKIEEDFARKEAEIKKQSMKADEEKQALLDNELAKLNAIKKKYEELNEEAAKMGNPGSWDNLIKEQEKAIARLMPKAQGWLQRITNPFITGNGVNDLRAKEGDTEAEYLENIRKEYKSVVAEVADAEKTYNKFLADKRAMGVVDEDALNRAKIQLDNLNNRKKVIEDIGRALGVSVDTKTKTASTGGKTAEQTQLETRINTMKDLLKWYEKLKEVGMGMDEIKSTLKTFFPDNSSVIEAGTYREELLGMASALEKFGEAAKKSAQGIRDDLAGNGIDLVIENYKKMTDAAKDFADYMKNWNETGEMFGFGVTFDISKVVKNYEKKLSDVLNKEREARDKLLAKENAKTSGIKFGDEYSAFLDQINKLVSEGKMNALAEAKDAINGLGESWVKSWDKIESFDIERFGDLTTRELRKLRESLLSFTAADIPDEIRKQFDGIEGGMQAFLVGVDDFITKLLRKTNEKMVDKAFSDIKNTASSITQVLSSLQNFAKVSGNGGLSILADAISTSMSNILDVFEKIKNQDYIGAATASVAQLATAIIDSQTKILEAKSAFAELKREVASYLAQLALTKNTDGVFGQNTLRQLQNAYKVAAEYSDKLTAFNDMTIRMNRSRFIFGGDWENLTDVISELGLDFDDLEQRLKGIQYILKMADVEKSDYMNITSTEREQLALYEAAIQSYLDAQDQITQIIKDTWSATASSIADSMIDAYIEMGDAGYGLAENMQEVFSDLGKSIAQELISSFILDNILAKYENDLKAIYNEMGSQNDINKIAQLFGSIANNVSKDASIAAEFTNQLMNALEQYGVSFSQSAEGLSSGITSITEDTANLLAAYINAMRSDLAGHRAEVQGISADVKAILGLLPSAPTLTEYLTQIQANTYNTAANTAEILGRLDSVIGDGASSFVRIQ